MGRKYDTRGASESVQSREASKGSDRRIPAESREETQQRLSEAIEDVRGEAEQSDSNSDGQGADENGAETGGETTREMSTAEAGTGIDQNTLERMGEILNESENERESDGMDNGEADEGDRQEQTEMSTDGPTPISGEFEGMGIEGEASPDELAHEYLNDGAVADRHRGENGDGGQRAIPTEEDGTERVGGWSEYDEGNAEEIESLADLSESGRTMKYMDRVSLEDNADGTDTAFVTHYRDEARPDVDADSPRVTFARNQMATYAFCDAVGVDVPQHTYNSDEQWVAAYGIKGNSVSDLRWESFDEGERQELAQSIDRDEFRDQMAVQLLAGNTDLHEHNIHIDDDGGVHCIDLDLGGRRHHDLNTATINAGKATETSQTIADERTPKGEEPDDDFRVEPHEVASRAQEIAVSIHNSGDTERVMDSVAAYDEEFPRQPDRAESIRENIELFVEAARDGRTPQPIGEE